MQPTEQELRATVQRMEAQLLSQDATSIEPLLHHYRQLCDRFKADLGEGRDLYLAKASALMLIQAVAQNSGKN